MAYKRKDLFGRTVIYTDVSDITKENIAEIVKKAAQTHEKNAADIDYLYNYYKGNQPILQRVKKFRDDINNKVVENGANEIVSFKVGYLMGEPVQYVNQADDEYSEVVSTLNDYMRYEDKESKDKSLVTWNNICGTAYRMVIPDEKPVEDEAPFEIYTLDPRNTFIVYYSGLGNERKVGVTILTTEDNKKKYVGYTKTNYFEIVDNEVIAWNNHILGDVPIIEYPANDARLGAFETVIPLLDALNNIQSNRIDGLEQVIQSILVLKGSDGTEEDFEKVKAYGGMHLPLDGDAFYLSTVINQSETQTMVDYIYDRVLTICGMPNRNTSSAGDNGVAVVYRDGWWAAESRAKDAEGSFKSSEREFLKIALRIMNADKRTDLRISHIEIRFTRRNYENIAEKSQVLIAMLNNDKIHPKLAFEHSGMFVDPEVAWQMSEAYADGKLESDMRYLDAYSLNEAQKEKSAIDEEVINNA